ncbi:protein FREE1-like [Quillaja saponaria]|uniref:Protein FREE1-like n=1 Tax=Quillaja saponaria TaxID=32244 RepID=A0AAD7PTH6_QUISA|nr:protein FREE1-like [Quillaja saponaria]
MTIILVISTETFVYGNYTQESSLIFPHPLANCSFLSFLLHPVHRSEKNLTAFSISLRLGRPPKPAMQQGDYSSAPYYHYPHSQNPNPNPNPNPIPHHADLHPNPYASAPPFSSGYTPSDFTTYPPYPQNPDPISFPTPTPTPAPAPPSPTAPSYSPPSIPNLLAFNTSAQPSSFPSFESHVPHQPSSEQQPYYPPYDQHLAAPNYAPPSSSVPPTSNTITAPSYSSSFSAPYNNPVSSVPPVYENPVKFDQGGAYFDDRYGHYNQSRSDLGSDLYGKRLDTGFSRYDSGGDNVYGDGVYAYEGGKVEPYGARGTAPKSSTWAAFDDYGRSISFPSSKEAPVSSNKIVKAAPKFDAQQDDKGGVQKFRVKLLPESGGQSTMDVLCEIGLDGIRMLDPNTNRTLKIYPIENITRCEKMDSSTLSFWSKSSVDIEPRRIRLQSNSYTTNTLLDIVTAATVQLKEMGGRSRSSESIKMNEQPAEKKKGLGDWMNLIKPANEEKDHWVPDEAVSKCNGCGTDFSAFIRKHHCRNCGDIFCDKCTQGRIALNADENAQPVRVCDRCMAEVTQRLSNAKEAASKPAGLQSHEDLARKLQEEMERNRKASSGSKYDGSERQMKEVACPTCTVHLQVQVPTSGSETIECGVCQHPFLVSAH